MKESHKELLEKIGSFIWEVGSFIWNIIWSMTKCFLMLFLWALVASFCNAFNIPIPIPKPNPDDNNKKPPDNPDKIKKKKVEKLIEEYPILPDTPTEEKILQKLMNAPKGKLISEILTEEEIRILFIMILRGFGISI
jgi:hypothetical protein